MCGIAGIACHDPAAKLDPACIEQMCAVMEHRGPDDAGTFIEPGIALGHRRLSIIDLQGGAQPMANEDGLIQIVFNGEIYNFKQLRAELETAGHVFRTCSDTETIVHLYEEHGDDCVNHLRGMFAFALWDRPRRRLLLARDRLGQKPLYYCDDGDRLIFASEMKAILQVPGVRREVAPEAIDAFLTYQYVPHPGTIFKGICKLPPAHILVYQDGSTRTSPYWELEFQPDPRLTVPEIKECLVAILDEATRLRMMSDVPLGAFLSGGIDSSITVALMARNSSEPVKTFSIGFEEQDYSEVAYARQVAERYHTEHHEFTVKPEAADVLPKLAWHYDEPFADASALPTYYVAKVTSQHVKVALSGDGGDENFGGYLRYQRLQLAALAAGTLGRVLGIARAPAPASRPPGASRGMPWERLRRCAVSFLCDPRESYLRTVCMLDHGLRSFLYTPGFTEQVGAVRPESFVLDAFNRFPGDSVVGAATAVDICSYLPCAILAKVDIASMANSLEVRSPFLDHKLVEFAARIPTRLKLRFFQGKHILKETFRDLLPATILRRRKMGFGIPIHRWLSHDLYDFLVEQLLSRRALSRGYFRPEAVRALIQEHREGRVNHGYHLWPLLMLELWHRAYVDVPGQNAR